MRPSRGFALIASLLLCVVLFALGTGLLSKSAFQYEGAALFPQISQARALARAGLSDAHVKLSRDYAFPPLSTADQQVFSYAEKVRDSLGREVGSYHVDIDRSLSLSPWKILQIRSEGQVGRARYVLVGELDIAVYLRPGSSTDNPSLLRWLQVEELGNP